MDETTPEMRLVSFAKEADGNVDTLIEGLLKASKEEGWIGPSLYLSRLDRQNKEWSEVLGTG